MPDQAALRPVLLRRMKEDVEDLPDKEEIVVSVELTPEQRHYYKAIFEKQASVTFACCCLVVRLQACEHASYHGTEWHIRSHDARHSKVMVPSGRGSLWALCQHFGVHMHAALRSSESGSKTVGHHQDLLTPTLSICHPYLHKG